ncbi:NADH-ubiquinone oxidoreductase 21.3 kDa subunit [Xylariomycetidae sp. FL0641]|nr:NADH-ubiquinone oxidoreductase 21.3 kDa subunit [Xylariomycetidae sp. FL0641]
MASKAVAKAAGGVVPISQKQTVQSTGIWERIRRAFAVDPNRSTGVPLNPYYRTPTPGSLDPLSYDDPVTAPAGDIADNAYWQRDTRRAYPRLSFVNQGHAAGLLGVGSAAAPRQELVGDAGARQLVAAREQGAQQGLAVALKNTPQTVLAKDILVDGMPPLPSGQRMRQDGAWEAYQYQPTEEQAYPQEYPCRTFQ